MVARADAELLDAFESGTLSPSAFHHREHVRLAWLYLRQESFLGAIGGFTEGLKRFAARAGKEGLYHETITWAYLVLIHERLARPTAGSTFEVFAKRNADLFARSPSVLDRYYRPETLASDVARRAFVLPDRIDHARTGTPHALGDHPRYPSP